MERTHSNRSTVDDDISVFQQPGSYPGSYPQAAKASPKSDPPPPGVLIMDVWDDNFEEEAFKVMKLVEKYKFVAIDTEFPGFLAKPTGPADYYKTLARNVEEMKIIQVGFSFADENGKVPEGVNSWQFNLKFDLEKDTSVSDSIALLKSCGINFDNLAKKGIPHTKFAEWLTISDLTFNDDIKWVAFNGGFDFAYLLRLLSNTRLPDKEDEFYKMLQVYFPTFYDVKYITKDLDNLYYLSLAKLSETLGIKRVGMTHQAGSDALVTLEAFFRVKVMYLRNHLDNYKYANVLDGMHVENDMMKDYFTNYGAPTLFADYSYPPTPGGYMNFTPIALTPQTHGMMYRGYYDFQVASMLAATTPVKLMYTGPYIMDNGM